jgi:5-hydroxyisourate hydrolase
MHGCPAAHLQIQLWQLHVQTQQRTLLKTVWTAANGRTEAPLLAGEELHAALYELIFAVGDYFIRERGVALPEPAFLTDVPVRFGIADPQAHYHVPLLVSPWAYSTYRGS